MPELIPVRMEQNPYFGILLIQTQMLKQESMNKLGTLALVL